MKSAAEKCGLQSDQSLRAYYREFRRVVELSDVVLEVLDARDPLGCRCLQVEQAILTSPGAHKKLILVLNKIGELEQTRTQLETLVGPIRQTSISQGCILLLGH